MWLFVRIENQGKRKAIENCFKGRTPLMSELFYEQHFANTGIPSEIVLGVKEVLEYELGADLSRMKKSDDFSKNLNFFWNYDSLASVSIVCALEDKFSIKISDQEAENAQTIEDVILLVHQKKSYQTI
jgi:acyl carrier protein